LSVNCFFSVSMCSKIMGRKTAGARRIRTSPCGVSG
jgi:hypothetical protein